MNEMYYEGANDRRIERYRRETQRRQGSRARAAWIRRKAGGEDVRGLR